MTLPTLISKYRKFELKNRFKVSYTLVLQATSSFGNDKYDIVQDYCGYNIYQERLMGTFAYDYSKYFHHTILKPYSKLKRLVGYSDLHGPDGSKLNYYFNDGKFFVLNNGMVIMTPSKCIFTGYARPNSTPRPVGFWVDINGSKRPNKVGFDIFFFQILRNNILMPSQLTHNMPYVEESTDCNFFETISANRNGLACTYYALRDEFPDDKTKSYWDNLPNF